MYLTLCASCSRYETNKQTRHTNKERERDRERERDVQKERKKRKAGLYKCENKLFVRLSVYME